MTTATVVVCVYTEKRWDDIVAAVESVAAQDVAPVETLVVVDHNPALLERAQAELPDVRVLANAHVQGLSGARNTAIAEAKGDVVVFLDDDARARPGWLAALLEPYEDATVQAVGGVAHPRWPTWPNGGRRPNVLPGAHPTDGDATGELDWIVGCTYTGQPTERAEVRNLMGCNMSFRREVFERIGGFAEEIGRIGKNPLGCEETELCIRARQAWARGGREDPDRVRAARRGRPPRQPRPRRMGVPAPAQLGRGPVQGGGGAARGLRRRAVHRARLRGQGAPHGGRPRAAAAARHRRRRPSSPRWPGPRRATSAAGCPAPRPVCACPRPVAEHHRAVTSFVHHRARLTDGQRAAWDRWWPVRGHDVADLVNGALDYDPAAWFGRAAPLILEIGSGMGESTAALAAAEPDVDHLAVEVFEPGHRGAAHAGRGGGADQPGRAARRRRRAADRDRCRKPRWPGSGSSSRTRGPSAATTSAGSCSPRSSPSPPPASGPAAPCTWPPTGPTTPTRCARSPTPSRCSSGGEVPRPPWRPVTKFEARARAEGRDVHDFVYRRPPCDHEG